MSEQVAELYRALKQRIGYEVVKEQVTNSQIRVIGRVPQQLTRNWIVVMHHLLLGENAAPWSLDVSKQYFLRGGQVVWGWRLIFQASSIEDHIPGIIQLLGSAPKAKFMVEEQRLPGVRGQRVTMNDRGKGASGVLKSQAGPQAVKHAQRVARGA